MIQGRWPAAVVWINVLVSARGESDGIKHCRMMKWRHRAHLGFMKRKCDTTRRNGDVGRRRAPPGRGKGGDDASWPDANLTEPKIKKIHAVDSAATNGR
jgi:hypothetical protein